jgi:hypothetical protein
MARTKLASCVLAALITLAGATHLAQPAQAAEALSDCTASQRAYAEGYADGACGGSGSVSSCQQTGGGGFNFNWVCIE